MKKFYSLKSSAMVLAGCTLLFLTLTSSDNGGSGVNNAAQNGAGCGSCHGSSANPSTTISLSGAPAGGYVPGSTYPMTLTIANPSMPKCGFDLYVTGGTMAGNPSGTTLTPVSFNQIRHNTPLTMSSGSYVCNFNWTAPAAGGAVTFKVVANAVNGNGQDDNGDQWNTAQFPITQAPNAVAHVELAGIKLFPNPATDLLTLELSTNAAIGQCNITNMSGQRFNVPTQVQGNMVKMNVATLLPGIYYVSMMHEGALQHISFIKR
ncbi:MAG: T9SS type A sorting domain-containing protein [Chitinophagaceae bacterium]|nr:T9SS type A sorting domain-containing protein [Chitinophagaceae bacterium]